MINTESCLNYNCFHNRVDHLRRCLIRDCKCKKFTEKKGILYKVAKTLKKFS